MANKRIGNYPTVVVGFRIPRDWVAILEQDGKNAADVVREMVQEKLNADGYDTSLRLPAKVRVDRRGAGADRGCTEQRSIEREAPAVVDGREPSRLPGLELLAARPEPRIPDIIPDRGVDNIQVDVRAEPKVKGSEIARHVAQRMGHAVGCACFNCAQTLRFISTQRDSGKKEAKKR